MQQTNKNHIIITELVKNRIKLQKVVLPASYAKIYTEEALSLNINLQINELLDPEMLGDKVVHHVVSLTSCTQKAINAIETEDKTALSEVLEETKALHLEIEELRKMVYEDALTKSYNRKWFEDTYLQSDKLTTIEDGTIVVIDLNKFKYINDTFGHNIGDKVLTHVAHKLKESGGDVIRYGGDEFLVLFKQVESPIIVEKKFETMISKCDKTTFKFENHNFKISFAYGVTSFQKGSSISSVIEIADKKMYANKRGRAS